MPHEKIFAEGQVCSPWAGPFVAEYSFLENSAFIPGDFVTAIRSYEIGRWLLDTYQEPKVIGVGARIFFGFDANKRQCGKYRFFGEDGKATTLTIFFAHKEVIKLPGLGFFNAGRKHMITIVRNSAATFAMCSYSAPHAYYNNMPMPTQFLNPSMSASPTPTTSPTPSESASVSVTPSVSVSPSQKTGRSSSSSSSNSQCFPADAMVKLRTGVIRRMADLQVGDEVLVAAGLYSRVFMFTHRQPYGIYRFMRFLMVDGNILLVTEGHFVYANGVLKAARDVKINDTLEHANKKSIQVQKIEQAFDTGLYNPQTEHGDIIVSGFRLSTYTETIEPKAAHALLSIFRFLRRHTGIVCNLFEKRLTFRSK